MSLFMRWTTLMSFVLVLSFDLTGMGLSASTSEPPALGLGGIAAVNETLEMTAFESRVGVRAKIDVVGVARVVGEQNPELSTVERERIGAAVMRYSAKYDLEPSLVTAVLLVESGSRPWVVSPRGAVGLMQVMPYMFEALPIAGNLTSIESNIEAGCWILADDIRRLGLEDGVSAYFWGSNIRDVAYRNRVFARRAELERQVGLSDPL